MNVISATSVLLMFQTTRLLPGGTTMPSGIEMFAAAAVAAATVTRYRNWAGTVGPVPHARATVPVGDGSRASCDWSVTGVVGVIPIASGNPIPNVPPAGPPIEISISVTRSSEVAAAINSAAAAPEPVPVVLTA